MTLTGDRPVCACGLKMLNTRGPGEGYVCPNCDAAQAEEYFGYERRKTDRDIRFALFWRRYEADHFVDNTTQDDTGVGTTNPDGDGETPPVDEGDTNGS